MTYEDLKTMLEHMTPEQLAQEVRIWGDEISLKPHSLLPLEEDYVNLGEGFEPAAGYEEDDEALAGAVARLPKGTHILWVE